MGDITLDSNSAASYSYGYDGLGRQDSVTTSISGLTPTVVLTSGYDNNNRTGLAATVAGTADFTNTYGYDALNRLTSVQQTGTSGGNVVAAKLVNLGYYANGQLQTLNRYSNTTGTQQVAGSAYTYDAAGRMNMLVNTPSATGSTAVTQSWTYDKASRVVTYGNSVDGTQTYTYDAAGQLASDTGAGIPSSSYTYDANGNRTNAGYTTVSPNRVTSDGTYNYTYDAEGNMVTQTTIATGVVRSFSYDNRNRLVDVFDRQSGILGAPIQEVTYSYDALDRLVSRSVITYTLHVSSGGGDNGGDGGEGIHINPIITPTYDATTVANDQYVYDGDHPVLDFQGGSTLAHRYLYGNVVDQVLAQENVAADPASSGRVSWFETDNLGSTRDLVNNAGAVIDHYKYDAFGDVISGDTTATLFLYTGRVLDQATGLQYNRERWLDSAIGRWMSEDPIGFAGGQANLYVYVGNDPTKFTDPTGLVDFVFNPDPIKNAPWHAAPGQNTGTTTSFKGTGAKVIAVPGCPDKYKVQITIKFTATIYLDTNKFGPGDLPGVYGHEQRHLQNYLAELQQWVLEAQAVENPDYESQQEAQAAADAFASTFVGEIIPFDTREKNHQNKPIPANATPYPPIGGMFPPPS